MTKLSLVLVSPSTVMQLNVSSAISSVICCNTGWAMLASVAIKPSMVAMFGQIMPAPLAMPVTCTEWRLPTCPCVLADLATVSVVMMARAAKPQSTGRAVGSAATIF